MKNLLKLVFLSLLVYLFTGCNQHKSENMTIKDSPYQPRQYVELTTPQWAASATIYEVNIRQFTPEGTFKAFASHLPRLKQMGIDIIWLMPVHPIGEKNRKGNLGSYYSVKDYYGINPEFGNIDDFKELVDEIHSMGMYVIIDWVANHSAWDNPLVELHPEWYTRNPDGNFQPTPWYDWDDIIDFDFSQPALREYMTKAMTHWVREHNIDGFRADVAGFIPIDFWENLRSELEEVKPVFMLAEWESRDLHSRSFDMTYAWSLWDVMHDATVKGKGIGGLMEFLAHHVSTFPEGAIRMTFTDNHDKNSWVGSQFSFFGEGLEACMVFASTIQGMPLVYNGQEAGLDRSLAFFEKDSITWKDHHFYDMYSKLFALKKSNKALWNGHWGGPMVQVFHDQPQSVIAFSRQKDEDKIISMFNFSEQPVEVTVAAKYHQGNFTELFSEESREFTGDETFTLEPWGYKVWVLNP